MRRTSYIPWMQKLKALWRGDIDLRDAFWTWVVFGGLMVNVTTSILFLVLITRDLPWLALAVGFSQTCPGEPSGQQ
jgi:hypothetical protein